MLVEPALLVYLGADTFQEAERPPFDVASCGHFAHRRLLPAHEDEHAIFRLGPHGRYRTPGPSVGMYRQRPVLDVLVRSGDVAAAFLLRDDSVTVRHDGHQAASGCRKQNPLRPAPLHRPVLLPWTAFFRPRGVWVNRKIREGVAQPRVGSDAGPLPAGLVQAALIGIAKCRVSPQPYRAV